MSAGKVVYEMSSYEENVTVHAPPVMYWVANQGANSTPDYSACQFAGWLSSPSKKKKNIARASATVSFGRTWHTARRQRQHDEQGKRSSASLRVREQRVKTHFVQKTVRK